MANGKFKIKYSVQFTFMTIFFLFIVLMTGLLTVYPTTSSRDIVFSTKRSSMLSQATVMSSSLSVLERLSFDNVNQVMELVDVKSFDRIIVTDGAGFAIYDSYGSGSADGRFVAFPETSKALSGEAAFYSSFDGQAFASRAATPVYSSGVLIGTVYLSEYDADQAALIGGIQAKLRNIAVMSGVVVFLLVFLFTKALTGRITALVKAMRIVREGQYDYRLTPRGYDEVTELAEEFNDMTNRLQKTEELRRRFVSDASHELRTPLASIRLLSDSILQSEDMEKETMREFVSDIGTEAERLQRMTEKLMNLTRMDSKAAVSRGSVDMRRVAEKTIHLLSPLAKSSNVKIYPDFEDGCVILASEDDIYQIIFNLAENAIKYNSFGGNVFMRLRAGGGRVQLVIEDTGIGIPEEDIPHIFSRFYRVDKARSRSAGGSGLGLSIVYDAVRLHGGDIRVERRETVGTRFIVSFPPLEADREERQEEEGRRSGDDE